MRRRADAPTKKPSGGRPVPRRLFSFDALKKDKATEVQAESSSNGRSNTVLPDKAVAESPEDSAVEGAGWTGIPLVTSPVLDVEPVPRTMETPPPLDISRATTGLTSVDTPGPPLSPSRRRWETVRVHMLPSITSIDSDSLPSPPASDTTVIPSRPSTPKIPRFGYNRKVFRQVVETVQTQQAGETKRFAEAIRSACWQARFGDGSQPPKAEREGTLNVGSSLHLPFMASSASLLAASSSNISVVQSTNKSNAMKRPQSVMSVAHGRAASITHIARVIASTPSANRPLHLPHEDLVLSTLLLPFFDPPEGTRVDYEQESAVETFEYVIRTWFKVSNEVALERCLWCCRAASIPSRSRIRVLGTLSSILFSRERPFHADSPAIFQTLLQELFSLKYCLSLSPGSASEMGSLAGYISAICSGSCGDLSQAAVELEFGVRFAKTDNEATIREALVIESLVRCLEAGDVRRQRWILRTMLEEHWPLPAPQLALTQLLSCAHWRKLQTFISSAVLLLAQPSDDTYLDNEIIFDVLHTRIVAEVSAMREEEAAEIRKLVVRLVMEMLCIRGSNKHEHLLSIFSGWYRRDSEWKTSVEDALRDLVQQADWPTIVRLTTSVVTEAPEDMQVALVLLILPLIHNRLVSDPAEAPFLPLTRLLTFLAQSHPKVFFKPLFTCATANKEITVVNQLSILSAVGKFLPDLWIWDAEMMSVAVMSDAMGSKSSPAPDDSGSRWGKPRLGQCVLLIELLEHLHTILESRDLSMLQAAARFAVALESRLGLLIEVKEKNLLIPRSQRLLFCALFRVIRLLSRSTRSASWLGSSVDWVLQGYGTDSMAELSTEDNDELPSTLQKLQDIYSLAKERSSAGKRRNTAMSIFSLDRKASLHPEPDAVNDPFTAKLKRLDSLFGANEAISLELFVLVSALLGPEHFDKLGPLLWSNLLGVAHPDSIAPSCFLIMQFAEKRPEKFTSLVESELSCDDALIKRQVLQKIGILASWRFQIVSQEVILDRAHRRPFKLQRPPVQFVATDIGSSLFVYEDDDDDYKDINGHVIPLELRRRLSEIGWEQEDRIVDRRLQRIKTPMTLLPNQQLERVDFDNEDSTASPVIPEPQSPSPSPEPSPSKRTSGGDASLVRRDSTPSGRSSGVKRRPIFVAALAELFPKIASLIADRDLFVASAAQDLLIDFMRDDPSLLSRSVFQLITGGDPSMVKAFTALRAFLHVRAVLPPAMTHHILNHLTGFLKSSRGNETWDALRGYGYSAPIIAKVITQVSKMSMREIKRAKVDAFVMPSGSLWFPPSAPSGPLFPRSLEPSKNPFESLPPSLVWMTLVRTSQNMLFIKVLKRNPQDVKVIRKAMANLALPTLGRNGNDATLTLMDLVPCHPEPESNSHDPANVMLSALSLTLARSYLLLIQQVFQCMSRHLNDREELASVVHGLNKILAIHGDDIGIVAHTLLALMIASTRFKRLFLSGGYTLFMPALIKVYVECEHDDNIRHAIEYATSRFYALHQESFVFQTFDVIAQILSFTHADQPWIATGIYTLFATLRGDALGALPDAAGIHNLNRAQEQEALMITIAEEVPQTLISTFRRNGGNDKSAASFQIPDEYEGKRLHLDDLIRLFLTVIAHDSGTQRAEQFLKVLRLLTPQLYDASGPARTVLRGGVDALGSILLAKLSTKPKSSDNQGPHKQPEEFKYQEYMDEKAASGRRSAAGDLLSMRLEYLALILAYTNAGGQVGHQTTLRIVEIIKILMKDAIPTISDQVSTFLARYAKTVLTRKDNPPSAKEVIAVLDAIAPLAGAYVAKVDFNLAALYDVLVELAENAVLLTDPSFSRLLVGQYCRIGLDACEVASAADMLFSFPLRAKVVALVNCMVCCASSDVMEQIESREPTHDFLAGVILPMVLTLKSSADIMADSQYTDGWRRDAHSKVWLRLLTYAMAACERDRGVKDRRHRRSLSITGPDRQKAQAKPAAPLMSVCMALQALKVITIRAEDDISSAPYGLWDRIATLLKKLLADGDAMFALRSTDYSEPPSPAYSPRVSSFPDEKNPLPTFPSSMSTRSRQTLFPPRMLDYLAWSVIQWLWLRRTPLMLQMRIFAQERVANLATELRLQGSGGLGSVSRSRPVSTVFSKPRKSMLAHSPASSAASTPRNSTFISTSISLPLLSDFPSSASLSPSQPSRTAGYARQPSPISPSGRTSQEVKGHRIIHLGPMDDSTSAAVAVGPERPTSVASELVAPRSGARSLARNTLVHSPGLIRLTYRRIRLIQHLMGYSDLLPLNGSEYIPPEGLDGEVKIWSSRAAIEAIVDETKELMSEFNGDMDVMDESFALIESRDFFPSSGSQESAV